MTALTDPLEGRSLVLGLGITGRAVARALVRRGGDVVLVDDRPGPAARDLATELDRPLEARPDEDRLRDLLAGCVAFVPSPGVPERHAAFRVAAELGVPRWGELDLAAGWDDRPCVAVTGTDGKTTVTTMTARILVADGIRAVDAGNTDVPLVEAIDDPWPELFVVEASSFRLAPLRRFRPRVAAWLNFAADHLDVHLDVAGYESAKARLFELLTDEDLAVGARDDPTVMRHLRRVARAQTFGLGPPGGQGSDLPHWHVAAGRLRTPEGEPFCRVADLPRALPHDVANALAATATAVGAGASLDAAAEALIAFRGLPHRVELVGESGDVRWYDDSKATVPHATLAAVGGFRSVVLIAGGRNKGLDLGALRAAVPHLRAVVAIGEAAGAVADAFAGRCQVRPAGSMDEAVAAARDLAQPGDVVLLSPACASYDWYRSYADRGDDFARAARELAGVRPVGQADRPEAS